MYSINKLGKGRKMARFERAWGLYGAWGSCWEFSTGLVVAVVAFWNHTSAVAAVRLD